MSKNVVVAGGLVAAVVLAFYPIYFRPKFFPEEYSEYPTAASGYHMHVRVGALYNMWFMSS